MLRILKLYSKDVIIYKLKVGKRKEISMRVGFSTSNVMSCQPLSFGSGDNPKVKPQTAEKPSPESDAEKQLKILQGKYDLLSKKYDIALRLAAASTNFFAVQYNNMMKNHNASKTYSAN